MAELAFHKSASGLGLSASQSFRAVQSYRLAPNPGDAADVVGSSSRPNICLVVLMCSTNLTAQH